MKILFSTCTFILILWFSAVTNAQEKDVVILTGAVTDDMGALVPAAAVKVYSKNGKTFETLTDESGVYTLQVENGRYTVRISLTPFKEFVIEEYLVANRGKMQLDVSLICEQCPIIEDFPLPDNNTEIIMPEVRLTDRVTLKPIKQRDNNF